MAKTHPRKATTEGAARRDREFAQRQAYELARLKRTQQRIRDLSRQLKDAIIRADIERIDAAKVLVQDTTFRVMSEQMAEAGAQRLNQLFERLDQAEQMLAALDKRLTAASV